MPLSHAFHSRYLVSCALALVLLAGCAVDPESRAARAHETEPRVQREASLQSSWRGRSYHTLLETYGTPHVIMDLPGHRPVKTSIAVFGVQQESVYCIDAFTIIVIEEKVLVSDYFCR